MTTAVQLQRTTVPLARIARPASRKPTTVTTVVLAANDWLPTAPVRVIAELEHVTGPTRCSSVALAAYPPHDASRILDELVGVEPDELAGARLAVQACGDRPFLWLFVATCQVLWTQTTEQVAQS